MRNVDLEEATEGTMDREKNKCVYTTKDRTTKRKYVTERESDETEDEVLRTCDASGWSEEGDDAGTWRGKKEKGTSKKKMAGKNTRGNGYETGETEGGDKRSGDVESAAGDDRQNSAT